MRCAVAIFVCGGAFMASETYNNIVTLDVEQEQDINKLSYRVPTGATVSDSIKNTIHALKSSDMTVLKIAQEVKLSRNTVYAILRDVAPDPRQVEQIKKELAGKYYRKAEQCLDNIDLNKIDDCSGYQLAGMSKLLLEAGRLHEGQSTQNIDIKALTCDVVELNRQLAEAEQALSGFEGTE